MAPGSPFAVQGSKASPTAISKAVDTVQKASRYALPITIVNSPADIGVSVPGGEHPPGAFHDGRIYLFSDNLTSTADVYFTLFHELFHLGLSKTIDPKA